MTFKALYILFFTAFWVKASYCATYYVKSTGGTSTGLDDANAWSLAKLNSAKLAPGDRILLKRGDVFYGTYTCNSGGTPGKPIIFDAYGTGPNPVISGLAKLMSWTFFKENIYYTLLEVPSLNMVTLDGKVMGMGRYPDNAYLPYSSHKDNASISGVSVSQLPYDPSGGEVVIRKNRWILDRHPIQSKNGTTLLYNKNNDYGNNNLYSPIDGNGYFIQNHLSTLTKEGEWYYDKNSNRLYMHFGVSSPGGRTIKASKYQQNLYLNYWTNLNFNNIDFEGGNLYGAYLIGTNNIEFNHCNFNFQGGDGIWGSYLKNVTIRNSTLTNSLNNGIIIEQDGKDINIDQVKTTNSGFIAGMGRSGDGAQEGIVVVGNGVSITNCSVINSGYIGINFQGNDVLVAQNLVDTFSNVKDDGAGIYTYNPGTTASNRVIRKNIVLNAVGAFAGAEGHYWEAYGKAAGIYLDDRSINTLVDENTIANGNWGGIFLHNCGNNQITNNLVYNFAQQLLFGAESSKINRNFVVTGNAFIAKTALQKTAQIDFSVDDSPKLMGIFDKNIYARPVDDNQTFTINQTYAGGGGEKNLSLANWKSEYAQDINSSKSKVTTSLETNFRFEFNYSGQKRTVPVGDCYLDVSNFRYTGPVEMAPYSGIVLIKTSCSNRVESVASGNWADPTVWSGGFVPSLGSQVEIRSGHVITVDEDMSGININVESGGELYFRNWAKKR